MAWTENPASLVSPKKLNKKNETGIVFVLMSLLTDGWQ